MASLGWVAMAGYLLFAPAEGPIPVELGVGEARVTAQPTGTYLGHSFSVPIDARPSRTPPASEPPAPRSAALRAADAARDAALRRAFMARFADLPAVDPRVGTVASLPTRASTLAPAVAPVALQAPGTRLGNAFAIASNVQVAPPAGTGNTANWPAITQSGRYGILAWDSHAVNFTAGTSGPYGFLDPVTYPPGMPDYGNRQEVMYEPGSDTFFWLRLGGQNVGSSTDAHNRILLEMSRDAFATSLCGVEIRPDRFSFFLTNTYLDAPRLSFSSSYLYMSFEAYDFTNGRIGAFQTHVLARFDLQELTSCTQLWGTAWTFVDGWSPTLVSGARDIMYLGDHIVTSTGFNNTFRLYWINEFGSALRFVDRTISPWLYTNGTAQCFISTGLNPCAGADHSITSGVVQHNSPVPGNTGAAGDKVDFYWNVQQGNGFTRPYIESAGFHGSSLTYIQRKSVESSSVTYWDASVAADARGHVALAAQVYFDAADPAAPSLAVAVDDDFNDSPHTAGWFFEPVAQSNAAWPRVSRGTRVQPYLPTGLGWVVSGKIWDGANQRFAPVHAVVMRSRDLPQYYRFDQS